MIDSVRGLLARFAFGAALVVAACSVETATDGAPDAGAEDGGAPSADAGTTSPEVDGAPARTPADAGTDADDGILGTLSGTCGVLRSRLGDPAAALDHDLLVFTSGEVYAKTSLSADGQRLFDTPNAGGSSAESEVMSLEVLRACEGAKLLKTETEVLYPPDGGSITDILVEIDGKKVGVSVTRAYKPTTQTLTDGDIATLLTKKLEGINQSTLRVLPADKWVRQILHVFAVDQAAADAVERVWKTLSPALRADTLVLVTQTKGGGFIYCNPDPPLGTECN